MSPGGRPNVGPNRHAAQHAKTNFDVGCLACLAPPKIPTLVRWPCFLGDSESNFLRTLLLASFFIHKHAVISHLNWGTKHIIVPTCFSRWCLDHRPTHRGEVRSIAYRSAGVNAAKYRSFHQIWAIKMAIQAGARTVLTRTCFFIFRIF